MSDFLDEALRHALQRKAAPEGFAERLNERLVRRQRSRPVWYSALAAAIALLVVFAGMAQRWERERAAQRTEQQVVFAIALAMEKFDHVNQRLERTAPQVQVDRKERGNKL